jgi:hypothetical protein
MRAPKRKTAARVRGSGSRGDLVTPNQYHRPAKNATSELVAEVDVYDGRRWLGSIRAQAGKYLAFDFNGHRIGVFDKEREAATALHEASRPGGPE